MPVIFSATNGPFAAGATPRWTGQIFDDAGVPISAAQLASLTLSIVDTLSGQVINGADAVSILNTGRGTVDAQGNVVLKLEVGDTAMTETTSRQVQRSLVFDWTYNGGVSAGRHQTNFMLVQLAGD